jgi:dihydrofolate reductase
MKSKGKVGTDEEVPEIQDSRLNTIMSKVKVAAFSVSLDGYGAGRDQSKEEPLGKRGEELHEWIFPTQMFNKLYSKGEGTEGVDNDFAEKSFENLGAWIMGRNMFGPIRGAWPNDEWKGWWGKNPPYHVPVFLYLFSPITQEKR